MSVGDFLTTGDPAALRVVHVCYTDAKGGAAIGAYRLHSAMRASGVDSNLAVVLKFTHDEHVIPIPNRKWRRAGIRYFNQALRSLHASGNPVIRSINAIPTGAGRFLDSLGADILQLHWVCADTISIGEIANLRTPTVWKLPDMWAFSGSEHYLLPGDPPRYRDGYLRDNRPIHESGIDLNRWLWLYKRHKWRDAHFSIVGPSQWIASCAHASGLFSHRRIRSIPNPLDLELYRPLDKDDVRREYGLPVGKRLIMFGAMHATQDQRKGLHHLQAALHRLPAHLASGDAELVILGADGNSAEKMAGYNVHYLGIIRDEGRLVRAYNTADLLVLPTEMDNLPNMVKEASACGVPCVGFDVGGMPDMVDHLETGYLARPYDIDELARGIAWTASSASPEMGAVVRRRAEARHAPALAVERYLDFYREILACNRIRSCEP